MPDEYLSRLSTLLEPHLLLSRALSVRSKQRIFTQTRTNAMVRRIYFLTVEILTVSGIFRGTSTLLFGTVTPDSQGTTVSVKPGDVVVVPSGVAHSSVEASDDYAYIGVYPVDAPRWRNEFGKTPVHDPAMQRELEEVKIPGKCPVEGSEGALVKIWNERRGKAKL